MVLSALFFKTPELNVTETMVSLSHAGRYRRGLLPYHLAARRDLCRLYEIHWAICGVANGPARIEVDLKRCRELTLVVKWGDGGNVGDYVNWGDARLIKE